MKRTRNHPSTHALLKRTCSCVSLLSHRREHIMLTRKERSEPHKLFCSSLNGLEICKIQLEEVRLATSTFFEIFNGCLPLGDISTSNPNFSVLRKQHLCTKVCRWVKVSKNDWSNSRAHPGSFLSNARVASSNKDDLTSHIGNIICREHYFRWGMFAEKG